MSEPTFQLFGLLIAGRPFNTNFQPPATDKWVATIEQPATVDEFAICLLQPDKISDDHAILVFYQGADNQWQYVGKISRSYPPAIFKSPWYGEEFPNNTQSLLLGL